MIMKVQMNRVTKRRKTKTEDFSGTMDVSALLMSVVYECVLLLIIIMLHSVAQLMM